MENPFFRVNSTKGDYPVTVFIYGEQALRAYKVVTKAAERARRGLQASTLLMAVMFALWGAGFVFVLSQEGSPYWSWMVGGIAFVSILLVVVTSVWARRDEQLKAADRNLAIFEGRIVNGLLRSDGVVTLDDYSMNRLAHHAWQLVQQYPERAAVFFAEPAVVRADENYRHRHHGNIYRETSDLLSYQSRLPVVIAARKYFGVNEPFWPWMDELVRHHSEMLEAFHKVYGTK